MMGKILYVVDEMWVYDYYKLCCLKWQTPSTTEAILPNSGQNL